MTRIRANGLNTQYPIQTPTQKIDITNVEEPVFNLPPFMKGKSHFLGIGINLEKLNTSFDQTSESEDLKNTCDRNDKSCSPHCQFLLDYYAAKVVSMRDWIEHLQDRIQEYKKKLRAVESKIIINASIVIVFVALDFHKFSSPQSWMPIITNVCFCTYFVSFVCVWICISFDIRSSSGSIYILNKFILIVFFW